MISPEETKRLIRAKGLCGHVADGRVCILLIGHDQGMHDRGWTVEKLVKDDPYAHDSRCSIVVYYVSDGTKTFETDSKEHAEWLAEVLTRLDAGSSLAMPADRASLIGLIKMIVQSHGWDEDTAVDLMVEYLRQEAENLRLVHAHDAVDALIDHIASLGMARGLIAFLQGASKERNP